MDGSFYPGLEIGSEWCSPIGVWTYGRLSILFENMRYRAVFESKDKRLELLRKLNDEAGLSIDEERVDGRPGVSLSEFCDATRLSALLGVLDWYLEQVTA